MRKSMKGEIMKVVMVGTTKEEMVVRVEMVVREEMVMDQLEVRSLEQVVQDLLLMELEQVLQEQEQVLQGQEQVLQELVLALQVAKDPRLGTVSLPDILPSKENEPVT